MIFKCLHTYANGTACLMAVILVLARQTSFGQQAPANGESNIRLNQIGFYPDAPKTAVILTGSSNVFYIQAIDKKTVFTANSIEASRHKLKQ